MSKIPYRIYVAIACFLMTLCLGALYAWPIFIPHLEAEFGWSRATVTLPFTVASVVLALGMVPAGRLQDLKGPRILVTMSAVLVLFGYVLSSFSQSILLFVISYGFILGVAIATGYMASVGGGLKWFPDMKGTATGILVGGFGLGAAVFGPLAQQMIELVGWRQSFIVMGVVFSVVIGLISLVVKNPPAGWQPPGWNPSKGKGLGRVSPEYTGLDFTPQAMAKTPQFTLMWVQYLLVLSAGFAILIHLKPLAEEFAGFAPLAAAGLVSLFSAANFAGRFFLSPLSDVIGRIKSFNIIAVLMMIATASAAVAVTSDIPIMLYFTAMAGGVAFGGYLALSPAFTADMWGSKNFGVNYGVMFTAWGAASFAGPYFTGLAYDVLNSYVVAYAVFAALCIPGIAITMWWVKPAALIAFAKKHRLAS